MFSKHNNFWFLLSTDSSTLTILQLITLKAIDGWFVPSLNKLQMYIKNILLFFPTLLIWIKTKSEKLFIVTQNILDYGVGIYLFFQLIT